MLFKGNGLSDIKNEILYESVVKAAAAAVEAVQASLASKSSTTTIDKVNIDQFINSEKLDSNEIGQRSSDKPVSLSSQSTISSTSSASSINENYEDEDLKVDQKPLTQPQQQRPNRTKFSNIQIRALNQLFKQQRYPKDEQVAKLAKQLHLNQRVITVWFQNARQKARKSHANGSAVNKSQSSPSKSSQDYEDYDDLEESNYDQDYQDDEDNNNYYETNDTDFDDNHSQLSSESLRSTEKAEEIAQHKDEANVAPNTKALQLAMSFIAAHQAGGSSSAIGKDQSFAALAAAFNSSMSKNASLDNIDQKQNEDEDDENTTGCDDNEISDDEENENDHEEYTSLSSSYQMPHTAYQGSSLLNSNISNNSSNSAKRLRTTILPEQQEYLMQKYQLDQNPSRKMLDEIAREVRLKKRVVQVWFQNTRARERKGIIKINNNPMPSSNSLMSSASSTSSSISTTSSSINLQKQQSAGLTTPAAAAAGTNQFCKRCLFCSNNLSAYSSNVFVNRSSLESHLILKHNYTSEQTSLIDIEQFPDVDSQQDMKLHKQMRLSSTSPNVSPLPPPPPPATNLQNFYSNLLLQQQQQQFTPNALLQNALLQSKSFKINLSFIT